MNDIPLSLLFSALFVLLCCSAFFSSSETALMALNRYRLLHLAREGDRGAQLATKLLQTPDRLIGLILLGNNFVNILASAIATVAFVRMVGESGVLVATGVMTVVVLIFAEVAPKTLAAFNPERIALPASYVLWPMLRALYPLVRLINVLAAGVLRLVGHRGGQKAEDALSPEELRTLLEEGGQLLPERHRHMLLNILSLEEARVEDIMVPRTEIRSIDLDQDTESLRRELAEFPYGRAVVHRDGIDNVLGILNLRSLLSLHALHELDAKAVEARLRKPYFVPEGTRLPQQLLEFQRQQRRSGLVVDEYGDIVGLITLADILEEIVGEFTSAPKHTVRRVEKLAGGAVLVDGRIPVHSLNRRLGWELPTDSANTLSGLIIEQMESLPNIGQEAVVQGLRMRFEQVEDNVITLVRIEPAAPQPGL
ncbi:HlyC/CorC family transporter [Pseudomarimonas salicorniae]|uniref:HlyC/CorC family transporter n=1 Tax=Pseudomarimonas salicorniae TaxID=2933270 RepID=A0ABT0GHI0_9GAMM|nr:HlyC/CorC family transporter [Lysobacter sp. CAU 1642]MCK7593502.1 HlyC/CorC family transporter [Lysobacter sp. CAU 1642]